MYSIDLKKITLGEFEMMISTANLLPFQRSILNNLSENIQKLKSNGITNVEGLQILLKNKKKYPEISDETGIDIDYLKTLNMMVNSYVVKTLPIVKLEIFTDGELLILASKNIKNTKHYYEVFISEKHRVNASDQMNIPLEKIEYALRIIDLLRLNGVGVQYAKMLYEIGVKSIYDYNNTPSKTILEGIKNLNKVKKITKATLGISDIDYCRRFSERLDCDIK